MDNATSPKVLTALMDKYKIAPLKRFGQNFLIDGNIAQKIAAAAVPEPGFVLEIGPGFGALTKKLLERAQMLAAYEIDAGLSRALRDIFNDANFTLFHKDFLKADIETDLFNIFEREQIFVAANLPYYISSQIIMKLLESKLNIKLITIMVQKEVAGRICANPGDKDYGGFSAAVGYFAQPRLIMNVSSSCFYPKPDVESAVVQLIKKSRSDTNSAIYLKTVKILFGMRRKTVNSNLRAAIGGDAAKKVLDLAQVDKSARAEVLSIDEIKNISSKLKDYL